MYRWNAEFITKYEPSIAFLELFALTAGIFIWQDQQEMMNTRVVIFCDNNSAKFNVNTYASNCKQCRKLLRLIALNCLKYNRRIHVKYVESKKNVLADSLSRMRFDKFWEDAPDDMNSKPDAMPKELIPMEKIWFS